MHILVSNDDGYTAPGLVALVESLRSLAEVTVVAPETNHSGASNSLTLTRPLAVRHAANGFIYVNGTPSDCVHVALTGLLDRRPDLVVSGINNGANMGDDTLYSGTVAAASEGYLFGIPAIAFSLVSKSWSKTLCISVPPNLAPRHPSWFVVLMKILCFLKFLYLIYNLRLIINYLEILVHAKMLLLYLVFLVLVIVQYSQWCKTIH